MCLLPPVGQVPESLVAWNSGESPVEAPTRLLSASPWGLWWGLEAAWGEELARPRPVERGLRGVVRPPGSVPEPRLLLQVPSCVGGQVFLSSGPPCPLLEDPQRIHPTPDSQARPGVTWGQLHTVLTGRRIPGWYGERCVSRENRPEQAQRQTPSWRQKRVSGAGGTSRDHTGRTSIPQVVLEGSREKGLLGGGNSAISQGLEGVAPDGKAPAELCAQSPVKTQTASLSKPWAFGLLWGCRSTVASAERQGVHASVWEKPAPTSQAERDARGSPGGLCCPVSSHMAYEHFLSWHLIHLMNLKHQCILEIT